MMTRLSKILTARAMRFARAENGASTIPAVLFLPLLLSIMFSSVEIGLLNLRQVLLDRGLDQTVRILRLGQAVLPADQTQALTMIKRSICTNIAFVQSCMQDLTVEIFEVDRQITVSGTTKNPIVTRNWTSSGRGTKASCTDRNLTSPPVTTLNRATPDDLMLVRACLKVNPVMPTYALGSILVKDSSDMVALVSTSAWVREPYYGTGGT